MAYQPQYVMLNLTEIKRLYDHVLKEYTKNVKLMDGHVVNDTSGDDRIILLSQNTELGPIHYAVPIKEFFDHKEELLKQNYNHIHIITPEFLKEITDWDNT